MSDIEEIVKVKLTLKKEVAVSTGCPYVYAKAWIIEEEMMNENPPESVKKMHTIRRKQVITKTLKAAGFEKQGKHSSQPLLVLRM